MSDVVNSASRTEFAEMFIEMVQEYHDEGVERGDYLRCPDVLAAIERAKREWVEDPSRVALLLRCAEHLLLAATGPDDGPDKWTVERDKFIESARQIATDEVVAKAMEKSK